MSAQIDNMTEGSRERLQQWVNRSAGQRKRAVSASFAQIMPVIDAARASGAVTEEGNIEFIGPEPIEPLSFADWISVVGWIGISTGILYGTVRWMLS